MLTDKSRTCLPPVSPSSLFFFVSTEMSSTQSAATRKRARAAVEAAAPSRGGGASSVPVAGGRGAALRGGSVPLADMARVGGVASADDDDDGMDALRLGDDDRRSEGKDEPEDSDQEALAHGMAASDVSAAQRAIRDFLPPASTGGAAAALGHGLPGPIPAIPGAPLHPVPAAGTGGGGVAAPPALSAAAAAGAAAAAAYARNLADAQVAAMRERMRLNAPGVGARPPALDLRWQAAMDHRDHDGADDDAVGLMIPVAGAGPAAVALFAPGTVARGAVVVQPPPRVVAGAHAPLGFVPPPDLNNAADAVSAVGY